MADVREIGGAGEQGIRQAGSLRARKWGGSWGA